MARLKKVDLFPGFVRTGEVNYEVLARCTELAKGDRSLREFADICGTTAATISRIMNQQISAPIADQLLKSIADNAPKGSNVTLDIMLVANGMQPVRIDNVSAKDAAAIDFRRDESLSERVAREILQNELLFKGFSVELTMEPRIVNTKTFGYRADFSFTTNALEKIGISQWYFDVMSNFALHTEHRMQSLFSACYLGNLAEEHKKLSLVVLNEDTFKQLKNKYEDYVIRDYVSIILIDPTNRRVVEEFNFATKMENYSIFTEVK